MAPQADTGARIDRIALEVRHLAKSYGLVNAVRDANLQVHAGEVMGLLGDNGAGKSTVVKCISGETSPDSGDILVGGSAVHLTSTADAQRHGIQTVFQDLALVPNLDVAANLFMNRELRATNPILRALGWMDRSGMNQEANQTLSRLGINIPSVRQPVGLLSGGQRQSVAVGRAVAWGRHIVVLDEPTAALGVDQSRLVLELVRRLRDEGVAVILISHNMNEVMQVCDRATIMRHGRTVAQVDIASTDIVSLISLITGRE